MPPSSCGMDFVLASIEWQVYFFNFWYPLLLDLLYPKFGRHGCGTRRVSLEDTQAPHRVPLPSIQATQDGFENAGGRHHGLCVWPSVCRANLSMLRTCLAPWRPTRSTAIRGMPLVHAPRLVEYCYQFGPSDHWKVVIPTFLRADLFVVVYLLLSIRGFPRCQPRT